MTSHPSAGAATTAPAFSSLTAFLGTRRIGHGAPAAVARAAAQALRDPAATTSGALLVFDDATGRTVELDLRGTPDEAAAAATRQQHQIQSGTPDAATAAAQAWAASTGDGAATSAPGPATATGAAPRGRGRPQLGVVAREVTLLPRHWEWLALQPGGASVALRKLVEEARRAHGAQDAARAAQERCHRFLTAIAGDMPRYEDALRALYARDVMTFDALISAWPEDVADQARRLSVDAFRPATAGASS